jgi:hypothetical protein
MLLNIEQTMCLNCDSKGFSLQQFRFRIQYNLSHLIIRISLPLPGLSALIQRWETPQEMTRAFISTRVVIQVLLVIILCIPPLTRRQDLSNNLPLPPLLIRLLRHLPRNRLLLRAMIEYPTSVLGTSIWTLAV